MPDALKILIVDDNPYDRELIERRLKRDLPEPGITSIGRQRDFQEIVEQPGFDFDVVLTDYQLGWGTGLDVLKVIQRTYPNTPVLMVTDTGGEEIAVEAMKAGLSDYVLKRYLNRVSLSIEESLIKRRLEWEHAEAIEQLRVSEERYRAISELTSDYAYAIGVEADGSTTYEWITQAFPRVTGFTLEEFIAAGGWQSLVHPEDRNVAQEHIYRALSGQTDVSEFRVLTKSGEVRWVRNYTNPAWDAAEERIVRVYAAAQDITERKKLEQRLTYQARHDLLTRLPNRIFFLNQLEHALKVARTEGSQVAVLFVDLNNFKLINDSLGHQVGDAFLGRIADRLQANVPTDSFVARYGGDEFTILLEHVASEEDVVSVAQQLITVVQQPVSIEDRELVTVPSIGIALSGEGEQSWSLIDHADIALYQAKRPDTANHYALFESKMRDEAQRRLELETDLRRALKKSELRVYYQPVVDLSNGQVCELEALVRWEHPKRGMISPGEFIPLAEANGMIVPIGRWVLQEACRQLAEWRTQGKDQSRLVMSVNLSSRQFQHPTLVSEIRDALANTELEPQSLKLELTETVIMEDTDTTLSVLSELKALGVRLAIDDFGTGYSSLSYLRRLPIDTVKIDRSFMRNIVHSSEDQTLVRAIVVASHALQRNVTVEGIETAEQLLLAGKLGCDSAQGFHFSKPVPACEIELR